MSKNLKAGRNDLCPCGSKKKFKKCCAAKQERRHRVSTALVVAVAAVVLGAIAFGAMSMGEDSSAAPMAGKTWSPEHGHWH
jgi:hypothetical protein